ncbi:acyl-coenzyme A thioesterase 1-like isoform X4 [Oncorhynchus clarkii lewisi]|uniref:acyl-coenzyme A thioesterase 1-like isoform X4 n=1 Tax=Oncorhynchus clarkii lewisi TaxID=490388 RepID=UPI0039B8989F
MLHQRVYGEVISKIWFIRFQTTLRSSSQQVCVRLLPSPRCFFDEPVRVKVDGLSPHQKVELWSKLKDDKGVIFRASALVAADASGQVDLFRSPSLGGSYTGVESMGLFWAMVAETPHSKLLKKNVLGSMMVDIEVLHGDTGELLATETNERRFMTEGVRRIPLGMKEGRIRGVLFLPPGQGPFPGVLDVYTLGGGISEVRASLLANKGFVVLALAYYGFQDLPRTVPKYFDLEYFEEAITFLRQQPQVVMYPRAGHFLEVPYMPHCPSGFHPAVGQVVVFGGEAKAHHQAQLDLWRRVQEFFRKHLEGNNTGEKATLYTRGLRSTVQASTLSSASPSMATPRTRMKQVGTLADFIAVLFCIMCCDSLPLEASTKVRVMQGQPPFSVGVFIGVTSAQTTQLCGRHPFMTM